jgi:hypothetical protein
MVLKLVFDERLFESKGKKFDLMDSRKVDETHSTSQNPPIRTPRIRLTNVSLASYRASTTSLRRI